MTQDELKQAAAEAALDYVVSHTEPGAIIGVGTGSTANFFIDALARVKDRIGGTVASSLASQKRLEGHGIAVIELNAVVDAGHQIPVYVDGADEINAGLEMIKGGGGALTREKIVAAVATTFVCVCDASKQVAALGRFPLPVEVAQELSALGGLPKLRQGFVTDNGNLILDVHGLNITQAKELETRISLITGVVTNGLFARRGADLLLLATPSGVRRISPA